MTEFKKNHKNNPSKQLAIIRNLSSQYELEITLQLARI